MKPHFCYNKSNLRTTNQFSKSCGIERIGIDDNQVVCGQIVQTNQREGKLNQLQLQSSTISTAQHNGGRSSDLKLKPIKV